MSKEEREAAINQKIEEIRRKNATITQRYQVGYLTRYIFKKFFITFDTTITRK
jgi:hypothetical protein